MGEVEKELEELEEELWRANREGDGDFYARMLREDAVSVSQFGTAGKEQVVALIQHNRDPFIRSALSEPQVRVLSPDSALITYRVGFTARTEQGDIDHVALATTVYARENAGWRVALHQQTPL